MKAARETRYVPGIELRASAPGSNSVGILDGYAAVFNSLSEDMGGWRETIRPGAFARSLANRDIFALLDHREEDLLGRTSSGTLKLVEDARGLPSTIDLPDATAGRNAAVYVSRGDIKGMSFSFSVVRDEWDLSGPIPIRTLIDLELYEVSPCRNPAYLETSIALRSLDQARAAAAPPEATPPAPAATETQVTPPIESRDLSLDLARARLCAADAF